MIFDKLAVVDGIIYFDYTNMSCSGQKDTVPKMEHFSSKLGYHPVYKYLDSKQLQWIKEKL